MNSSQLIDLIGEGFSDDPSRTQAPSGAYYSSPELHEAETEHVFAREWMFVCHQNDVASPGDYAVREVAGESIFVMRGKDAHIRAFYNVCVHRGHELLEHEGTVANVVSCPYHAWSYGTDGRLRGAPKSRQVEDFDRDVGLTKVAVDVVGGFVFVNLDRDAEPLAVVAPQFERILRSIVVECEDLEFVSVYTYNIAANWKIVTENFLEAYHVEFSGPAHQALGNVIDIDTYRYAIDGRTIEYLAGGGKPEVLPYEANEADRFTNLQGVPFHQVFLYPHMTFSVFPGTNLLFVFSMAPGGPDRCAERISFYALPGEVSDASKTAEAYVSNALNHEDIDLVEGVQRGVESRGYRPGRLMVDAKAEAGWGEQFVHHFNQLHVQTLSSRLDQ